MGVFLNGSAVVGRNTDQVQKSLEIYSAGATGRPILDEFQHLDINEASFAEHGGNTTVLYPASFADWDDASNFLSQALQTTVLSIHIHDGDLWMFVAFRNGDEVSWFNPWPDYWTRELKQAEYEKWAGNPGLIADIVGGIEAMDIDRYFIHWTFELLEQQPRLAYEGDEFCFGNCWQLVDFLRRCGFAFPDPPEEPDKVVDPTPEMLETWRRMDTAKLRHNAEVAWKRNDYAAALELLTELGDERRPSEDKKLDYCRRKIGDNNGGHNSRPWWKFWK